MVRFISLVFILLTFSFIFMSESISEKKIRDNKVEVPFIIQGEITERQSDLRINPIVESDIGFLLELGRHSSN